MNLFQKLVVGFILLTGIIVLNSCRKSEIITTPDSIAESKFFSLPSTADPMIGRIISELKVQKEKNPKLIESIVKRNGYPVWDKAQITKQNFLRRGMVAGEDTIVYIPLAIQGEEKVTAFFLATINNYIELQLYNKFEYEQFEFDTLGTNNANRLALQFMVLDFVTFGHKDFIIHDDRILKDFEIALGTRIKDRTVHIEYAGDNHYSRGWEVWEFEFCTSTRYLECTTNHSCCPDGSCSECQDQCWKTKKVCKKITKLVYYDDGYTPPSGGGGSGGGGGSLPGSPSTVQVCNPTPLIQNGLPPCPKGNSLGWEPIEPLTTISILSTSLNLTHDQINWLNNNPVFADELLAFLIESQGSVANGTNLPFYPSENPEAIIAAKSTLEVAMTGIVEAGFDQTHFAILVSNLPIPHNQTAFDPMWPFYFAMECINIKAEHPEWSNTKVYLEASLEVVHILLDVAGMVPVIGEIADLTNGGIYVLQGDGVNATLSFAATIPISGWATTTAKYAKKLITALDGSKRTLKWYKEANGMIKFGDRGLLRKVLGLSKGDSRVAHHLVPWEHCDKGIIQKAAAGDFHMNEILNGIPLSTVQHNGSHTLYNDKVYVKLQNLLSSATAQNWSNAQCANEIRNLANNIRNWIVTHPNESINNIIIP